LKRFRLLGLAFFVVACLAVGLWWFRGWHGLKLDTTYQAVLLENGQVYYGRIQHTDSEMTLLTDVYYVQSQVDTQTKEMKNILIRRGNEWHSPNRSVINTRHIVVIEPVTPGSKVAELITQLREKNP
jgi:hypothetical protein